MEENKEDEKYGINKRGKSAKEKRAKKRKGTNFVAIHNEDYLVTYINSVSKQFFEFI